MILIAGSSGYLGTKIIQYFSKKNINFIPLIKNLDDLKKINGKLDKDKKIYKYLRLSELKKDNIFKEKKIDIVINTVTKYDNKYNSFIQIYNSNFEFSKLIYKLSNNNKIKLFINIDTILFEKTNFYSLNKFFFRKFLNSINYDLEMSLVNIRFHNFFSYDEKESNLISLLIRKSKKNQSILLTKGNQKRDFIHIEDSVNFIYRIIKCKSYFKKRNIYSYEVGSGRSYSIKNIANLIRKKYNSDIKLNKFLLKYNNEYEKFNYFSNIKKFEKIFNWKPKNNIYKFFK